ncbi:unnamed protein product [Schistosoma margrebowiei]|uniref:Uncharacterized protein n=1 Tax=Schistosoma margrebowiei TaxID=48269 RepID=A0A183M272_9TREM|nr:unnamed protein product [Schistosoma margrebowiei]
MLSNEKFLLIKNKRNINVYVYSIDLLPLFLLHQYFCVKHHN